jgi:glutamine synthetase adenylyltransferase
MTVLKAVSAITACLPTSKEMRRETLAFTQMIADADALREALQQYVSRVELKFDRIPGRKQCAGQGAIYVRPQADPEVSRRDTAARRST